MPLNHIDESTLVQVIWMPFITWANVDRSLTSYQMVSLSHCEPSHCIFFLTHKQLKMYDCELNTVATDALVLKHQTISIHNDDLISIALDQLHTKLLDWQGRTLGTKNICGKRYLFLTGWNEKLHFTNWLIRFRIKLFYLSLCPSNKILNHRNWLSEGTKLILEPMLVISSTGYLETTSVKFYNQNTIAWTFKKCTSKFHLQNFSHFVQASMC